MDRASRRGSALLLSLGIGLLLGAGCGGGDDEGSEASGFTKASAPPEEIIAQIPGRPLFRKAQARGTYVGAAGPTRNLAVGFVVQGDQAVVYLCDGKKFADWFAGPVADGRLALESEKGTRIRATVTPRRVAGTVTIADGRELKYAAAPARKIRPRTGLFVFDDPSQKGFKARWIVTRDGARGLSTSATGTGVNSLTVTRTSTGTQTDTRFSGVSSGITQLQSSVTTLKTELAAASSESTSLSGTVGGK